MDVQNYPEPETHRGMEPALKHNILEAENNVRLTSSELANLWASYMESSLKVCVVKYFLKTVEDPEIRPVLEYALSLGQKHIERLSEIYAREKHPIPHGFTDEDINLNAPRLFSDSFILSYLEDMAKIRLDGYSTALQTAVRTDIRQYFTECVADPVELYNRTVSVMLSKGIYMRPPYIPVPEGVDFVKKQGFLTGYFGKRRPLTSIEISHIFSGLQRNLFRKALFTGLGQVAGSEQVRQYMERGKDLSTKHADALCSLLIKNDLPVSMAWDPGIMDSKISPFSDKLMMQSIRSSNVVLIGNYGKALSVSARHDLAAGFGRLVIEAGKYAEDGINILIDNGWFELPPQAEGRGSPAKRLH